MAKIACLHCDLLLTSVPIGQGSKAVCPRCNAILYHSNATLETNSALLLAALVIYFPTIFLPFLSMQRLGQSHSISLISSIFNNASTDLVSLSIIVFLLVIGLPLVKILGLLSITLPLSRGKLPLFGIVTTRIIINLAPWSMIEVYLAGTLVTLIKLSRLADIEFSSGFYLFIVFMVIDALVTLKLSTDLIWQRIAYLKNQRLDTDYLI